MADGARRAGWDHAYWLQALLAHGLDAFSHSILAGQLGDGMCWPCTQGALWTEPTNHYLPYHHMKWRCSWFLSLHAGEPCYSRSGYWTTSRSASLAFLLTRRQFQNVQHFLLWSIRGLRLWPLADVWVQQLEMEQSVIPGVRKGKALFLPLHLFMDKLRPNQASCSWKIPCNNILHTALK